MIKSVLQGRFSHRVCSLATLLRSSASVLARRAIGRPLVPEWTLAFEIGTLFLRHQFTHAFALGEITESRAYFDSLYFVLDSDLDVEIRPGNAGEPRGDWFIPRNCSSDAAMLYFHGGGYVFYAEVSRHSIAMLAQTLGVAIFAPDYRLTPEHPHPAQIDDALEAYRSLLRQGIKPGQLLVGGDSAGGHLALMTLVKIREAQLPQPALAIALSPWTDVGRPVSSNACYDIVQGYQALKFEQWLKGGREFTGVELSPICQDFRGLAPIYLQAGGKEVLVDMIRDFAEALKAQDARVRLDVWEHMTHEFHAYGNHLQESREALQRIREAIAWSTQSNGEKAFASSSRTEVDNLIPASGSAEPQPGRK